MTTTATAPGTVSWPPTSVPLSEQEITALRHPSEPSRFALAVLALALPTALALFVLASLGRATLLLVVAVSVLAGLLFVWVVLQVWRIRLLADAVLVSAQTLPELQELVDIVRGRLGYRRRLDVFVVDKVSRVLAGDAAPITLTSYFGMHVIVVEGEAVGDLSDDSERKRLLFTLATYVGALKVRYGQWWSPLLLAYQMSGLTTLVLPFVMPYYRATVYSGDRIAYGCWGELDVSLQAVYRSLVGREVAAHLRPEGLTGQALAARRRVLLRFAQLLRPTPHATNRYLELLAFVRASTPQIWAAHQRVLGTAGMRAERVLGALSQRRPLRQAPALAACLAVGLLVTGLAGGLELRDSPFAVAVAEMWQSANDSSTGPVANDGSTGPVTTDDATPTPTPTPTASPTPTYSGDSAALAHLLRLVPAADRDFCAPADPAGSGGALAVLVCRLTAAGTPNSLTLYAWASRPQMRAQFNQLGGSLPDGSCVGESGHQSTWTLDGVTKGPLACYTSQDQQTTMTWASRSTWVLAVAQDPSWSPDQMYQWWQKDGPVLR